MNPPQPTPPAYEPELLAVGFEMMAQMCSDEGDSEDAQLFMSAAHAIRRLLAERARLEAENRESKDLIENLETALKSARTGRAYAEERAVKTIKELENLRAQLEVVPTHQLDLVNDFAGPARNKMLIGGPCIHGVNNNGFECPLCHPPLDLDRAMKDSKTYFEKVSAAIDAARDPRP